MLYSFPHIALAFLRAPIQDNVLASRAVDLVAGLDLGAAQPLATFHFGGYHTGVPKVGLGIRGFAGEQWDTL